MQNALGLLRPLRVLLNVLAFVTAATIGGPLLDSTRGAAPRAAHQGVKHAQTYARIVATKGEGTILHKAAETRACVCVSLCFEEILYTSSL